MQFIATLFPYPKFINEPGDLIGWLGWGLLLFFTLWLTNRWKEKVFERIPSRRNLFLIFLVCVPLTTLLFGIQIGKGLNQGSVTALSSDPIFFFLAALPWILTTGMIGILPGMLLAGFSGLLQAIYQTHSLFTPLGLILLALVYGYFLRQNFRTPFFKFVRHPLGAAFFSSILFIPGLILFSFFSTPGTLATRLDHRIIQTWPIFMAVSLEMIIAGGVAEFIYHRKPEIWFSVDNLVPSPIEQSLKYQFLFATVPFLIAILISLAISIWVMAKNVSLQILRENLINGAETISGDVSSLVNHGQKYISEINSSDLLGKSQEEFQKIIQDHNQETNFFSEVLLIDGESMIIAAYPGEEQLSAGLNPEEFGNAEKFINGSKPVISVAPRKDGDIQVTFMSRIAGENGDARGILIGRTQFALNQDLEKLFAAMNTFERGTGNIILINGGGKALEEYDPDLTITNYESWSIDGTGFFSWANKKGEVSLNYFQPVSGSDWSMILNVPYSQINQKTFSIAFPTLFIITLLIGGAIIGLLISLNRVSGSLRTLSTETERITRGDLGAISPANGVDEVGKLGQSFEEMRLSLRSRLDELNQLVMVSKGVASSLDIEKSLQGVIKAALDSKGSSARIVLIPAVTLKAYPDSLFIIKAGALTDVYSYFDKPLFEYMKHQELLALPKPSRMRRLEIPNDLPTPSAIIARALHHEDTYYGVLWVAYEQSRDFSEDEIQFINMLGDQASLAASNAALFCSTEIVRQRLEAVLSSAPEPILVFDENDRLLLMNPAARDLNTLVTDVSKGNSLEETLAVRELINLIRRQESFTPLQGEITLTDRKVFQADVSPVYAQGSMIGKICLLREITGYKKLDTQKSEFVATVSHDLRSPLSMLKGYVTMLPMLGEMNDQQGDYLKKITSSIDGMSHLVNNLLDLGRIEAGEGIKLESIHPGPVIDRVVKTLIPEANHKSIILEAAYPEDTGQRILADAALLQQAIFNLVENAIHFTNVGGRVDVGYQFEGDKTVFYIKDNGIGISPIDLTALSNQIKSGSIDSSRGNSARSGVKLGLSIVKSIAEKHQGSIRMESQLGKGTVFYLEIPNLL
jgi:signal transduction histidine kinase/HAMP domain-containing protein